jgi:hypothetical protein
MALSYPDIFEPNNKQNAQLDADYLRGGTKVVADLPTLYGLSSGPGNGKYDQLKQYVTKVYVISQGAYYILKDITNCGNSTGWQLEKTVTSFTDLTNVPTNLAGYGINSSDPLFDNKYQKLPDGLISIDPIQQSGTTITVNNVSWRIDLVTHTVATQSFTITTADTGNQRIDLIVGDSSGNLSLVQGTEGTSDVIEPAVPAGSVRIAPIYVNGGTVTQPQPDLSKYVTIDSTEQTISGVKTFQNGLNLGPGVTIKAYASGDNSSLNYSIFSSASLRIRSGASLYSDFMADGVYTYSGIHRGIVVFPQNLNTDSQINFPVDVTGTVALLSDITNATAVLAPLASPGFTGIPTAPTPATADNSTTLATTAFVKANGLNYVPYSGATGYVDLGTNEIYAGAAEIGGTWANNAAAGGFYNLSPTGNAMWIKGGSATSHNTDFYDYNNNLIGYINGNGDVHFNGTITASNFTSTAGSSITGITLNTPNSIYASPINFTVASGIATGTLSFNTQAANVFFRTTAAGTPSFSVLLGSDVTGALGYTPYNPASYPVNLNGETLQSVVSRGNVVSSDIQYSAAPVNGTSLINKTYVDNLITGITWKNEVKAATTTNITLSGIQTVDGVSLSVNDRTLVRAQSDATQNGIYVVQSGSWTRATDANTGALLVSATVFVQLGTALGHTQWTCINSSTPNIGTDAINFGQVAGAGTYAAGTGVVLNGNTFGLDTYYTDNRYVSLSGTYNNPSWISSVAYNKLTGFPGTAIQFIKGDGTAAALQSADVTTALGYTPYNPSSYPVNSGGETLQSVTGRGATTTNAITAPFYNVTNTDGTGTVNMPLQNITPSTPGSGNMKLYYSSNGLTWITPTGFKRSFWGNSLTADRVYTLPDITGTLEIQTSKVQTVDNSSTNYPSTAAVQAYVTDQRKNYKAKILANGFTETFDYMDVAGTLLSLTGSAEVTNLQYKLGSGGTYAAFPAGGVTYTAGTEIYFTWTWVNSGNTRAVIIYTGKDN